MSTASEVVVTISSLSPSTPATAAPIGAPQMDPPSSDEAIASSAVSVAAVTPPQCSHNHDHRHHDHAEQVQTPLTPIEELFDCAKRNDLVHFVQLVAQYGDELVRERRDAQGHTLAHWAAQKANGEFLHYLHSLGAPLDLPSEDGKVKLHPIHWACAAGNLSALRALVLKLGIDVNTCDATKQRSPLLVAAQHGHPLLVLFCVRHGADVTLADADGDTAVHWAAYKGATEIVAVFQYLGVSSDAPDRFGQTPLHLAAMRGEISTVQFLVETLDADVQALDARKRTPRDLAVLKYHQDVSRYLKRRELRVAAWNVAAFTWWCDSGSRAPYYFTILNAVITLLLYLLVVLPAMPDRRGVMVPHLAWNVVTWFFFYRTVTTKPGSAPEDSERHAQAYDQVTEALINGDEDGEAEKTGESALVRAQRQCLERPLCHTCPFVDNCVGRDNYVAFLLFVTFLAVDLAGMEYVLYLLWRWHHHLRMFAIVAMLYLLVLLLPVAQLASFHMYLLARNRTTNEVLNADRYRFQQGGELRSYDRGVVRNVAERCFELHQEDDDLEETTELLDQKLSALPV
ncbi:hypothetical protein BBJ28_00016250 [Nothophytophthora sp. Chile5]|nr:hypothetical protein BBJ28_00016250 [Nothophytophthora sp. Chile5]